MTGNTHIYIKNKGAFCIMSASEQRWLATTNIAVASLPAVLFTQNGAGADPLRGWLNSKTITRHIRKGLINSHN
jgi:hypothetical protein